MIGHPKPFFIYPDQSNILWRWQKNPSDFNLVPYFCPLMDSSVHRNRVILLHASFWAVYISFFVYYVSSFQEGPDIDWGRIIFIVAVHMVGAILISYINYFYFLPKLLFQKKIGMFILVFVGAFSIIVFTRLQLERYFTELYFGEHDYLYRPRFVVQLVFSNLSIVIFVSLLRFAADWLDLQTTRKEIEKEKLTAELNFLKAQVNPHFLFNTLNNLYYLAYSKSDNTPEVIEKLSRMMRYMIYDSNYPQVQLSKEIDYMQNYISLEKLRLSDKVKINFLIEGEIDTVRITPLILITFLENAFKHGVTSTSKESWIEVSLVCKQDSLQFIVSNSKGNGIKTEEKSGIGLQNVKRRLDLSYPGKYKLDMKELDNEYRVNLSLDFT
jgi:two-component system, LytTR family, sensor histidine kinase AlgZ